MHGKFHFKHEETPKDRPGYVYLAKVDMTCRKWDHKEDLYKIGCSTDPEKRMDHLGAHHGIPFELITAGWTKDRYFAERVIHWQFSNFRWSPQMEYKYACWWPEEFFLFDDEMEELARFEIHAFRESEKKRRAYFRLSESEMISKMLKRRNAMSTNYSLLKFRH